MNSEALPPPTLVFESRMPDGSVTIVRVFVLADGRKIVRWERLAP